MSVIPKETTEVPSTSRELADAADLLAAWATLEAARGGPASTELAGFAGELRSVARKTGADTKSPGAGCSESPPDLHRFERRVESIRQNQGDICRLADKIAAAARRMTAALHCEGVVAYSRDRAARLRSLVAGLETQRSALGEALVADRARAESVARQPGERV